MSIGSPFPTKNQTFALDNPSITQTLWNEIARAVMATQRGLGSDVGDLASAWNARQQDIKDLVARRLVYDMGSFAMPEAAGGAYTDIEISGGYTETIEFRSGVFAGYQPEDIRIFVPSVYSPPWNDNGGSTSKAAKPMTTSIGAVTTTGSVGVDMVVTGFTIKLPAKFPDVLDSQLPRVFWLAMAGGNDGSGENGSTAGHPTRGFDYW